MATKKKAAAGTNLRKYPGYEDDSPAGRRQISAFNKAGGPNYLKSSSDKKKYAAAVAAGKKARDSGTKAPGTKSARR